MAFTWNENISIGSPITTNTLQEIRNNIDTMKSELDDTDSGLSSNISALQTNVNYFLELHDFLINGSIDEADTNLSIDFNKTLIRIGAL